MGIILVTNDDGILAPGLHALTAALSRLGRTVVVAPERDCSAASHSLTMTRPLRLRRHHPDWYGLDGTPADCVTVAVEKVLTEKPRLVVSGINPGPNLGDDINYSGTVSAAVEGALLGLPAMAVSLAGAEPFRFEAAAEVAVRVAAMILERGLDRDTLLNVNVPGLDAGRLTGFRFTRQGRRRYDDAIRELDDPWGRKHYWIGGGTPIWEGGEDTDEATLARGFISITPIQLDLTHHEALRRLRSAWADLNPLPEPGHEP